MSDRITDAELMALRAACEMGLRTATEVTPLNLALFTGPELGKNAVKEKIMILKEFQRLLDEIDLLTKDLADANDMLAILRDTGK